MLVHVKLSSMKKPNQLQLNMIGIGFIFGILWLVLIRFIFLPNSPHYHANFAVYINEQQEQFDSDLFYEEVQACSADEVGPRTRTHMHRPDSNVIHVHDEGVTWGNFFENLGVSLGNDFIKTSEGIFIDGEAGEFSLVLNGNSTKNIANKIIRSEDTLLIDFGDEQNIDSKFAGITHSANEFNSAADPSACKGANDSVTSRFKRAIWQ